MPQLRRRTLRPCCCSRDRELPRSPRCRARRALLVSPRVSNCLPWCCIGLMLPAFRSRGDERHWPEHQGSSNPAAWSLVPGVRFSCASDLLAPVRLSRRCVGASVRETATKLMRRPPRFCGLCSTFQCAFASIALSASRFRLLPSCQATVDASGACWSLRRSRQALPLSGRRAAVRLIGAYRHASIT